jgi:hypothetical protein
MRKGNTNSTSPDGDRGATVTRQAGTPTTGHASEPTGPRFQPVRRLPTMPFALDPERLDALQAHATSITDAAPPTTGEAGPETAPGASRDTAAGGQGYASRVTNRARAAKSR